MHTAEMGEIADEVQLISHDTKSRILQEAKTLMKQKSFKNGLNLKKKSVFLFAALMKSLRAQCKSWSG